MDTEFKSPKKSYLVVHEVWIHDQRRHSLDLICLLVLGVSEGGQLEPLPGELLLGGPRDLNTFTHRILIEMNSSGGRFTSGGSSYIQPQSFGRYRRTLGMKTYY